LVRGLAQSVCSSRMMPTEEKSATADTHFRVLRRRKGSRLEAAC
jgi:hypothetical protein